MADNVQLSAAVGSGAIAATDEVTYSGDTAAIQVVRFVHVSGAEGAKTVSELVKAEDAAHTSGDFGIPMLGVRQDTAASLAGTDGDYTLPIFDSTGKLHVNVGNTVTVASHAVTNAGTFAVQVDGNALTSLQLIDDIVFIDDEAYTPEARKLAAIGCMCDDTLPDSIHEGDIGIPRMSARREIYQQIRDAAGNERGANVNASNELLVALSSVPSHAVTNAGTFAVQAAQSGTWTVQPGNTANTTAWLVTGTGGTFPVTDSGGSLTVDNNGTFVVQVDGAALTALQLIDDAVFADDAAFTLTSSKVIVSGAIRDDALGALSAVEGDAVPLRVDANGAQWVVVSGTVTVGSHAVTNAGTFAVQVDGSALTALQLIDDPVFADDAAFTIGTSKVMMAGATVDETSTDSADEGDAVALRATADRKLVVTTKPTASGEGCDVFRSIDIDETEEDVKTSAGMLYGYYFANLHASSVRYLKFYNATAANTTVGTTTPFLTLPLPAASAGHISLPMPVKFDTALCAAATTAVADNDTGAPGANEVVLNVYYK